MTHSFPTRRSSDLLVDNPVVVQFAHRTLAYAVALAALATAWIAARRGAVRNAAELAGMTLLQFALGVATIVTGVELWLGVAHQAGAALLVIDRKSTRLNSSH